jgi:hypothetical protein
MHRLLTVLVGVSCLVAAAPAQDDYAKFRASIEKQLKQHPFFTKITFTLVDRPPFLFCVEKAPNDEKDYEIGVVNSFVPHLREMAAQFEEDYRQPCQLVRSPEAGGYALAVLSSAGRYLDFRTAIGDPSLAFARAHYTPSLRLAVTYKDKFANYNTNPEERHALLHEFVHALQHAHVANGQMTRPVWFNEGLADYRASSTNMPETLREPPLQDRHLAGLAFGYGNPAGRYYVAPIADLVSANSYKEVLDLAQKRNGVAVPAETVLAVFYSQSEMFVRFLHEAEQGKHRAAFLEYMRAAQRGESGLAVFQQALGLKGADALAALDAEWLRWLDGVLRKQYPTMRDLTKGAADRGGRSPLPPPGPFDLAGLRWTAADLADRLAGARRLAARGDYEGALAMLPEAGEEVPEAERAFVQREALRVAALVKLRDDVLADVMQKGQLSVNVGQSVVKGKVVRREAATIVLLVGKTETAVPLAALTPAILVREGNRLKRFEGKDRWLLIWTRWLKGESLANLQDLLKTEGAAIAELKGDLRGALDSTSGGAGASLAELMRLPQVDDAPKAAESLARLRELLRVHGKAPLLQRRKEAIDKLARAFAERAFRVDDVASLGIHGALARGEAGAIKVEYKDAAAAPNADFTALSAKEREPLDAGAPKIAHSGASGLFAQKAGYELLGSTWMRWAVPLGGVQVIELDFVINADFVPDFGIALCASEKSMLLVSPTGCVQVLDPEHDVVEPVGGGAEIVVGQTHRLRVEHDGTKAMKVSIDDKQTAQVRDVGRLKGGEVWLHVHSSTAVQIARLAIGGVPDPMDALPIRERYVAAVLGSLWP